MDENMKALIEHFRARLNKISDPKIIEEIKQSVLKGRCPTCWNALTKDGDCTNCILDDLLHRKELRRNLVSHYYNDIS